MSALWAPLTGGRDEVVVPRDRRSRLRAVPAPAARLARVPFLLVLIGVFGVGMVGLLMLNTTLQGQTFQARTLQRQASELTYTEAALSDQLDALAAPQELARRASLLGMRPNPYPALLVMPEGTVVGTPKAVRGGEVPSLVVKTDAQIAADQAAADARRVATATQKNDQQRASAFEVLKKAAEKPVDPTAKKTTATATGPTAATKRGN
ncbi:MAG: hypothetical protein JWP61_334 [Friedmanniella sp.]|nr:hypothetical protein [Friedmanniella sp.]